MITLKWEIIWTGGLPHLSGLPHLPGVPHLHLNRALGSTRSQRDLAKSRRVLGEISFISPKCLSSRRDLVAISEKLQISPSSWRDLVYLPEISFISVTSRLSRRNIFHLARLSARSRQYLARDLSRADLRNITNLDEFLTRSRRDLIYLAACDLRDITNLALVLARSRRDLVYLAAISETLQISPSSWRDLGEFSFISPRPSRHYKSRRGIGEISARSRLSRRDLRDITNLAEFSSRFR